MTTTLRTAFRRVLNRRSALRSGRLETIPFRDRLITVYLPAGYDERIEHHYPVLYMQDGQNLFDDARAFAGHSWRLQRAADEAIGSRKTAPMIIAGIDHAGDARANEFTPTFDAIKKIGGHADAYGRMLIDEVKPLIDARYRTNPDDNAIGGSSLGGLVSLYTALCHPDIFRRVAAMSPSVWWDHRVILREVDRYESPRRARIWLDIGGREGMEAINGARALRDRLRARGWTDANLGYFEDRRADHSEASWGARAAKMLEFLFPAS